MLWHVAERAQGTATRGSAEKAAAAMTQPKALFCMPTSMLMVRAERSLRPCSRAARYLIDDAVEMPCYAQSMRRIHLT